MIICEAHVREYAQGVQKGLGRPHLRIPRKAIVALDVKVHRLIEDAVTRNGGKRTLDVGAFITIPASGRTR